MAISAPLAAVWDTSPGPAWRAHRFERGTGIPYISIKVLEISLIPVSARREVAGEVQSLRRLYAEHGVC
jgi:hypothetical protein